MKEFLERVKCVIFKRRMVLFDRLGNTIGLAPETTKKGDVVCIVYGCSVPLLLRRYVNDVHEKCVGTQEPEREVNAKVHYEVIGEVYVNGYMDGEAFKNPASAFTPTEQSFMLR